MFFFFDTQKLKTLADRHRDTYRNAQPFPHIVIDDFLPQDVGDLLYKEFPAPSQIKWKQKIHEHSKKLAVSDETEMPPFIRHVLTQFNSASFVRFLENLTGIQGLVVDPYFKGGGLHQIERGGFLDVHADFNYHPTLSLDRRLNVLLYLNKDWQKEYGGSLELWDRMMKQPESVIPPLFNRCVIFNTTDTAYHGHPHPFNAPAGVTRKSLAFYYYSIGRPQNELSPPHSTLYQKPWGRKGWGPVTYVIKWIHNHS